MSAGGPSTLTKPQRGGARRSAGGVSLLLGFGFGVPCLLGLAYFMRTSQVWLLWDLPTYGDGPFERVGVDTSVGLLLAFLVVCVAEVVLGLMLIMGARVARMLSLVLLPIELVFWIGFALPFGPILGLVRTALLLSERRRVSYP